jgi:hypothetical protein
VTFRAEVADVPGFLVVRLAGRLERDQTSELAGVCAGAARPVRLDLTDLVSADEAGLETLGNLMGNGAEMVGASPYLALQLDYWLARRSGNARGDVADTVGAPQRRNEDTRNTEDR